MKSNIHSILLHIIPENYRPRPNDLFIQIALAIHIPIETRNPNKRMKSSWKFQKTNKDSNRKSLPICSQEGENVCKLEKADILELTVKHLHKLRETNTLFIGSQHQPPVSNTTPQVHVGKFWEGFNLCAGEVSQFLTKYDRKISQNLFRYIMGGYPNISYPPPPNDGWMHGRHVAAPDEESSVWRPW